MEELLIRHKKESKDLQNRITGMKKQATKSTRKQVNAKCSDLEHDMKARHEQEIKDLKGEPSGNEEVSPEELLGQLTLEARTPSLKTVTEQTPAVAPAQGKKRRNRQKERLAKRDAEIARMRKEAEAEAAKQPDLRKIEQDALDQLCELNHLIPYDIQPDGHCLFASVLDQLNIRHGAQDLDIYKLRSKACEYIRSHSEDFTPYLFDEQTMQLQNIDDYTREMEETAKWGGEIEILALSKVFDCPISVLMSGRATHVVNQAGSKPGLKLVYYKHSYALGEHYNSLHDASKKLNAADRDMSLARKVLLGRPSNNLTSGIVGLANVGKSTFFQAITNSKLGNPANYPFATIKPEEAKVQIPSRRLAHLKRLYQSEKCVPASLTMYDIAGLVRGASSGEGLGSTFLNDIRHVDGIYQVVRGFLKEDITHIEGSVDPVRDLSVVQDELILKDVEFLENIKERLQRKMGRTAKTSAEYREMTSELELMETLEEHLYEGRKIVHFKEDWAPEEVAVLNKHNFLTAKPSLILLNVSAQDYISQRNEFVDPVKQWLDAYSPGDEIILFSAEFETVYNEFKDKAEVDDFSQYCKDTWGVPNDQMVLVESALPTMLLKMRELLHLISFFTCGPLESRQWTIREGTTAPEAAGVIHTDLQNTFINASVTKYADLAALEPPLHESVLKAQGKIKRAGKLYEIEDGDIVLFKAAGGKTR